MFKMVFHQIFCVIPVSKNANIFKNLQNENKKIIPRQISYGITYVWNLKKLYKLYKSTYLKMNRLTDNKHGFHKERGVGNKLGVWNQQIQTTIYKIDQGFPGGLAVKNLPAKAGDEFDP